MPRYGLPAAPIGVVVPDLQSLLVQRIFGPKQEPGQETAAAPPTPGSATWTETEVDFGSTPTYGGTFTVTDASVGVGTPVAVMQSGNTATGRASGDALWDTVTYGAIQAAGSFTLYATATPGPIVGKRKLLYQVSA